MKTRGKQIAIVLAAIWLIAMIALAPLYLASHRERPAAMAVFDQYSSALVNRDYRAAYQLCDSDFRQANVT